MDSPLGLTNTSGVEKTETKISSNNKQANKDPKLANQDPEVSTQVQTANNNRNPNSTQNNTSGTTSSQTASAVSVFNPTANTHFNYRGTTDANRYEPNRLVPNQHEMSVRNLVEYLQGTAMELRLIDFIYLKKLGVFANNRMIVARRFGSPVLDDLFQTTIHPISTVVSWIDPEDDFFKISFNEVWEEHTDTIQKIFMDIIEKDLGVSTDPGISLPGWSTGIQFEILKALGVTNAGADNLPEGNPNLIMETSRRKVPGDSGGSGLNTDLSIVMKVEYEIKYIPGIDPSFAFHDILANLVTMGTSNSQFYLTGGAGATITSIVDKLRRGEYVEVVKIVIDTLIAAITSVIDKVQNLFTGNSSSDSEGGDDQQSAAATTGLITTALNSALQVGDMVLQGIISKYREKIYAAISAMTGSPNAPWHVSIGNPRKPFFVSGDMVCDKVTLEFGKELGFNDLPTEITATIEFRPARPWGAQEIMRKFNSGKGRIYGKPDADYFQNNGNNSSASNSGNSGNGSTNNSNVSNSQNSQNRSTNNSSSLGQANGPEDF
jgi:hypothetical protein